MKLFYLGLGSNIGEKEFYINRAVDLLAQRAGRVAARSSLYKSVAEGFESENLFVNAVVAVESDLSPLEMLDVTHKIELDLGCHTHRNADGSYCDRTLDIDIVACEDVVCDTDILTLPHPRMHMRRFVLEPLCEIAPGWVHPIFGRSAQALCEELR